MAQSINRLLIADPESNTPELIGALETMGFQVHITVDGQETLDALSSADFDLVCASVALTGVSIEDVLAQMKADERLMRIPVIILFKADEAEAMLRCMEAGADDYLGRPVNAKLLDLRVRNITIRQRLELAQQQQMAKAQHLVEQLEQIILPMGVALSTETDFDRLLERILIESKRVCNADAGTLYLRTEENTLRFAIVITDSLGIRLGGTSGNSVTFSMLPLYDEATGEPNHHNVTTYSALTGKSINIDDAYTADGFDFSGTKIFDMQNNYRTTSVLTVPLKDNTNSVIGVLQLINALDEDSNIIAFDDYQRLVVESLASQAAVVLNNHMLIEQKKMMSKIENDIQICLLYTSPSPRD